MFCPKCGSLLVPKKEGGKRILVCPSCGYSDKKTTQHLLKETLKPKKEIEVVEEKNDHLPEVEMKCPKCGNNKAYYWLVQTRAGDESETKFYKCTACNYTWRDYD